MGARTKEIIEGWEGDEEVEAILAEFDGDPRKAIRALLDDLAIFAEDRPGGPVMVAETRLPALPGG